MQTNDPIIIILGQTLYNNKEVKDLFVNVVDKIVEPLKQYKFSTEDLQNVGLINVMNTITSSFNIYSF